MELNKAKTAIIGLVVIGVAWQYLGSPPTEVLMGIVTGISGLGGYEIRGQGQETKEMTKKLGEQPTWWHKYYFRVIGYFLGAGGFGLIADELIQGTLDFSTIGHEWYGVILFLVSLGLISIKPHGKGDSL